MKKTHTHLSIFVLIFFTQVGIGQTEISVPWKISDDFKGRFDVITKSENTLYGYTGNTIYLSTDNGANWTYCSQNTVNGSHHIATKDSIILFYHLVSSYSSPSLYGPQSKSWHLKMGIECNTDVIGYASTYWQGAQHGGFNDNTTLSSIKILNDDLVIYTQHKKGEQTSMGVGKKYDSTKLKWFTDKKIKTIVLEDKLQNVYNGPYVKNVKHPFKAKANTIMAHFDTTFMAMYEDTTVILGDQNLNIIIEKVNPFFLSTSKINVGKSEVFVIQDNGHTYRTVDKGDTWISGDLSAYGSIDSYQYNQGIHLIETANQILFSTDFSNFSAFQAPLPNGPAPTKFFLFRDMILANTEDNLILYRSFDNGQTWETVYPQGIPLSYISGIIADTSGQTYVLAGTDVYRQVCPDSFQIDASYVQLAQAKNGMLVLDNQDVIRRNNKLIEKFNFSSKQWALLKTCPDSLETITKQGNEIILHYGHSIEVIDEAGASINSVLVPFPRIAYTGNDTILSAPLLPKSYLSLSVDNGANWQFITDANEWQDIIAHDGRFYTYTNELKIYSDITASPDTTISLFSNHKNVNLTTQNGVLFAINQSYANKEIVQINSDNSYVRYTNIPNLHKDNHPLDNIPAFYLDSTTNSMISILGEAGLCTSKYAYMDSTVLNNLPTTNYSNCYGQELNIDGQHYEYPGLFLKPGSCVNDELLNISYSYTQDSTISGLLCNNEESIYFSSVNKTFYYPGQYEGVIDGQNGACDTLVTIEVIKPPIVYDTLLLKYLCLGDSLNFMGQIYHNSGQYNLDTISSLSTGCDSIISILVIKKLYTPIDNHIHKTITCEGDYLLFNGQYYQGPNVYSLDTIVSTAGCDSLVNILHVDLLTGNNFCTSSGKVFFDYNQNGIQDISEQGMSGIPLFIEPISTTIYSQTGGYYYWYSTDTTELLSIRVNDPAWQITTDSVQNFHPLPSNDNGHHFGLNYPNPIHNGFVNLTSNPTRCNTLVKFSLLFKNTGSYNESTIINLNFDPEVAFYSASIIPNNVNTNDHILSWSYVNLVPFFDKKIDLFFEMPNESFSDSTLLFTTEMYSLSSGSEILLDQYTYTPTVLCSFDPNDKQVMPSGERNEHYTLHDQKLTYTVRFQNTGNAEAIDITIKDTIDMDLDISTLRIVNSSFPVQTTVKGQAIEFLFKNIWLPDSTSNEPESHGFVTYEIQPNADLLDYTEIKNTAYIIFDFNGAIITNTTTNTMVTVIPVALNELEKMDILIHPNPADDIIYISAKNHRPIDKVMIYNTLGQLMLAQNGSKIDVSHLPQGVYMVEVKIGEAIGIEKLVIE